MAEFRFGKLREHRCSFNPTQSGPVGQPAARPAVKRISDVPANQLLERSDAVDFKTKTQDKVAKTA